MSGIALRLWQHLKFEMSLKRLIAIKHEAWMERNQKPKTISELTKHRNDVKKKKKLLPNNFVVPCSLSCCRRQWLGRARRDKNYLFIEFVQTYSYSSTNSLCFFYFYFYSVRSFCLARNDKLSESYNIQWDHTICSLTHWFLYVGAHNILKKLFIS